MRISTQAFHVPKHGSSEKEYEDAVYPEDSVQAELKTCRCAVADGATESAFSREWAQILVNSFGEYQFRLKKQQTLWKGVVHQGSLPWYLESKICRGAHAAFVGLSLHDPWRNGDGHGPPKGIWRAFAVGDSCLFHVRGDRLLTAGPLSRSEEFGNNPFLLSTSSQPRVFGDGSMGNVMTGTWESEDVFYLATDALAQWLFAEEEAARPPWGMLRDLAPSLFKSIVPILRDTGRLHNDDTTLLRLEVS